MSNRCSAKPEKDNFKAKDAIEEYAAAPPERDFRFATISLQGISHHLRYLYSGTHISEDGTHVGNIFNY